MIKLGIVGFGTIARSQHVAAIAASGNFELVAIADPALPEADFPVFSDLTEMLASHPEIEAISMCQPPGFRYAAARTAIEARRHVMLEKPPALTCEEGRALLELARARGVALFAAWHSRAAAGVPAARDWLADSAIRSIKIEWKEDVRHWHPGQKWIWDEGGFGVFDPGINALSILTELLADPVIFNSAELEVPSNCAMPIAARMNMSGTAGFPIDALFDWRQTGPQTWDIRCETDQGTLVLSEGGARLAIDRVEVQTGSCDEYTNLYRRFAELAIARQADVDLEPLRLVARALSDGIVLQTEPFEA
ncbi:MAG: Gfo/Idh/MocA family oxidoreductase [Novosphingobium sp.]